MTSETHISKEEKKDKSCCNKNQVSDVKISQLPLYGNPYPPRDVIKNEERSQIEKAVQSCRQFLVTNFPFLKGIGSRTRLFIDTGIAHTKNTIDLINDDETILPKALLITGGGLLGFILASKKGFFKKVLFTGLGLSTTVAMAFPQETQETLQLGTYVAKNKGPEILKEIFGVNIDSWVNKNIKNDELNNQSQILDKFAETSSDIQQYGFKVK